MQLHANTQNSESDIATLKELRKLKPARHKISLEGRTRGERVSDWIAQTVGSWKFIIIQSIILVLWIVINVVSWIKGWDPYPFILLNLVLSFQAAFTAPIIMMSQNRQNDIDRLKLEGDYNVNVKAELEIETLHQKIDELREKEIKELIDIIRDLERKISGK